MTGFFYDFHHSEHFTMLRGEIFYVDIAMNGK